MKRFYICIATLALIVFICAYANVSITRMYRGMQDRIEAVEQAVEGDDHQALLESVEALDSFWREEEQKMMHYLRHSQMDGITQSVSRIPPFARYEEIPELMSELANVKWQVEHVYESERPIFRNIL